MVTAANDPEPTWRELLASWALAILVSPLAIGFVVVEAIRSWLARWKARR